MVKPEKTTKTARILMVLPTLGQRPDYLKQTLESIKSQSPTPYDIVMIYPLENKQTAELARQYGAKSLADPGTLSGAVNVGVASANDNHEFIGWIGDDDLISAGSLKAAIKTTKTSKQKKYTCNLILYRPYFHKNLYKLYPHHYT